MSNSENKASGNALLKTTLITLVAAVIVTVLFVMPAEFGIDPYVSLSYQPDHWPDPSVSGSASHYQGDYISDGGTSMSRSWEILTELDFAKFWPKVLDSEDEGMKLFFQVTSGTSREDWGDDVSRDSNLDYFLGLKVDLTFGEYNQ